jgi:DNA-binding transcriptional LysR family regulator
MTLESAKPSLERFDELAVFVEIASSGSVTAAAQRLGVPKSTVSRALRRLETALGTSLVRRMAHGGHTLTEHGQRLATLAGPHVAGLRDAALSLERSGVEPFGTIKITAPLDLGLAVLGPYLPSLAARHPALRIDVDLTPRMVDLVREGFDAALRVSTRALAPSTLVAKKLATIGMELYASPAYLARRDAPKKPEDLAMHDYVLFMPLKGKNVLRLDGRSKAERCEVEVTGRLGTNDLMFVREAVVAGAGIGGLPSFVARELVASGRLVRLLPSYAFMGAKVYFVHPPVRPLPAKIIVLRDFLQEVVPRALLPAL